MPEHLEKMKKIESHWNPNVIHPSSHKRSKTFLAGWKSELAGCRSTPSMSKIKVKIAETKFLSFTRPWYCQ